MTLTDRTVAVFAFAVAALVNAPGTFIEGFRAGLEDMRSIVGATRALQTGQISVGDLVHGDLVATNRAQLGGGMGNIVGYFIGVMIAGILCIAVTVPVILDTLDQSNVSGTTALVLSFVPTLIVVVFLVYVISPVMG